MIRCSDCGKEFEDDTSLVTCDNCGARLPRALALTVGSASTTNQEEFESASKSAASPEEDEDHLAAHHLATITEYGKAKPIITLIGFGGSGKTFLVNRLRDELPKAGWKSSKPPDKGEIPLDPDWLTLTKFVPPSLGQRPTQNHSSYVVVDCAGESLAEALDLQFETNTLEGERARSYVTAIACANAYVLVIRADELLGVSQGEGGNDLGRKKALERIDLINDRFNEIISAIVVSKERLQRQSPVEFLRQGISPDELAGALDRVDERFPQPLCVVLSQADRLDLGGKSDGYDADPFLFALQHGKKLFRAVDRAFDHYRFDFLSAFYGQTDNRPDYRKPSYGATEIVEWLHHHLAFNSSGRVGRLLRGEIPTRNLVALRRRFDPEFRRLWGPR